MTTSDLGWAPEACTLPTVDQPFRVAEFDDLFATAVRDVSRDGPTRLRLTLDQAAEARARDLTARESACCSFFGFAFGPAADGLLTLTVTVLPAHAGVLDAFAARAAA
jgi:hypothetical protein